MRSSSFTRVLFSVICIWVSSADKTYAKFGEMFNFSRDGKNGVMEENDAEFRGERCELDIGIVCALSSGASCDVATPNVVSCIGRPTMVGMLYNGGDCSQSFNEQDDGTFLCQDFQGGPPNTEGSLAWIVVTAIWDETTVYFRGPVAVGETFRLEDQGDPGAKFEADQTISIYRDSNESQSDLLQLIDYPSSCSQNLNLKNKFGAVQIIEWYNEEQGLVTCFSNISYDLIINIPLTISGDSLNLESLAIRTNFDGTKNLTLFVNGLTVPAGGSLNVELDVSINLAVRKYYTFLTSTTGRTNTGVFCSGVSYDSFPIGFPNAPDFPQLVLR